MEHPTVTPVQRDSDVPSILTKKRWDSSGDEPIYMQVSDNDAGYVIVDFSISYSVWSDAVSFNVYDE